MCLPPCQIQHGEPWRDLFYLNSLLQEVLLPHYPHLENWYCIYVYSTHDEREGEREGERESVCVCLCVLVCRFR